MRFEKILARGETVGRPQGDATDPIDRSYLARVTRGNHALEREVLELFAGQLPSYVEQLRGASTQKEWRMAAHTIKGSASAVGARQLSALAQAAEALDREVETGEGEGRRKQAIQDIAAAAAEASDFIARLFATA